VCVCVCVCVYVCQGHSREQRKLPSRPTGITHISMHVCFVCVPMFIIIIIIIITQGKRMRREITERIRWDSEGPMSKAARVTK
jgi:hypothetical protein